ncbi:MAG: hypothetical protein ACRDXE_07745 [Acidimicrobiales bacterium]
MSPAPMVHVRTVPTAFHARVIAARLGAEGILVELRGNIGGPYPFGHVSVWVGSDDADLASELLLADEVEAAFVPHPDDEEPSSLRRRIIFGLDRRRLLAAVGLVVIAWAGLATHLMT